MKERTVHVSLLLLLLDPVICQEAQARRAKIEPVYPTLTREKVLGAGPLDDSQVHTLVRL